MPALKTLLGITGDAAGGGVNIYGPNTSGAMATQSIGNAGHDVPHENRMPYLALNACIATAGQWPPRP